MMIYHLALFVCFISKAEVEHSPTYKWRVSDNKGFFVLNEKKNFVIFFVNHKKPLTICLNTYLFLSTTKLNFWMTDNSDIVGP